MKKKYFFKLTTIALALMFGITQAGATQLSIKLDAAGTLEARLGAQAKTVTDLTLSGPMNSADFLVLKSMGGLAGDIKGNLAILNLKDATPQGDSIPHDALATARKINTLVLPLSITRIGRLAFGGLSFTSIEIPAKVTEIGTSAFRAANNKTLTEITVAEGNSAFVSVDGVLYSADRKTVVVYPCHKLKGGAYTILDGVTHIAPSAFEYCELSEVTLPASVEVLGDYAFYSSYALSTIILENVKEIGNSAFASSGISGKLTLPKVVSIGNNGFNSAKITEVVTGDELESIGNNAFGYCESLVKATFGKMLNHIGTGSFDRSALNQVYCYATVPPAIDGTIALSSKFQENGTLYIPIGSKAAYQAVSPWSKIKKMEEVEITGLDDAEVKNAHVYATSGAVVVKSESAKIVRIYNAGGILITEQQITSTMQTVALPKGIYYVSLDSKTATAVAVN